MLDPENMNKGIASVPKDSDSEADLNFRVTWEACYKKLGFLCLIPRHSALGKNRMWTGNHTFIKNLQVILLQVAWELDFNQWPKRGQNTERNIQGIIWESKSVSMNSTTGLHWTEKPDHRCTQKVGLTVANHKTWNLGKWESNRSKVSWTCSSNTEQENLLNMARM